MRRSRKRAKRHIFAWMFFLFVVFILACFLSLTVYIKITESTLPPVPTFEEYAESAPKVTRMLARDGTVIAEFFTERRTIIRPDEIPPILEAAVLSAEDSDFYEHEGISYLGILRAMLVNLWRGKVTQGGSTITQQVIKQTLLSSERTVERKFREMLLARILEQRMTKKEILAVYMSEIYLGHGCYGFEEASRFYFAKRAKELSLSESSVLAGLISAPELYSPFKNPTLAVNRQHYVLQRMVETKRITLEQAKQAAQEKLILVGDKKKEFAQYFIEEARKEVIRLFGEGRILHDGLIIETTLDRKASQSAEMAVAFGIGELYTRGRTRISDEGKSNMSKEISDGSEQIEDLPPPPKAILGKVVECDKSASVIIVETLGRRTILDVRSLGFLVFAGQPDIWGICKEGTVIPVSQSGEKMEYKGSIFPVVNAELTPQPAMVILDPDDRGIVAMIGGLSFETSRFNRAVQSRRPIGSTVKPILYASALEAGISPYTTYQNTPVFFRGAHGRSWSPKNYEGGFDGREYTLQDALAKSINVIAVKVLADIKTERLVDMLERLGFQRPIPKDLTLALGSVETSPLILASAFATFASSGMYDTPYMIKRVLDYKGRVLMEHSPRPSREFSQSTAQIIKTWMRRAVTDGTGILASKLPVPVWGKTGTTNHSRETWFVGSDGKYIITVLVAYDDRLPMHMATGGNTAIELFNLFVKLHKE